MKDVDFDLFKGENIVLPGKFGIVESVLIKIIAGLLNPDRGEVFVLNKQVDKLDRKELDELRFQIGFSFQNSALCGLDPITSAEIIELINEVQQKYNTSSVIAGSCRPLRVLFISSSLSHSCQHFF